MILSIHESIQLFFVINILVMGVSHLVRPKIWIKFFEYLSSKGEVGNIFNAMLSLAMGSIIVSFHLVWQWPMIIVTIYGFLSLLKGSLFLIIPGIGLKSISSVNEQGWKFQVVGVIMCVIAIFVCYNLYLDIDIT